MRCRELPSSDSSGKPHSTGAPDYRASSAGGRIAAVSRGAPVGGQPLGEGFPPFGRREGSPPTRDGHAGGGRYTRTDSLRSLRDNPVGACTFILQGGALRGDESDQRKRPTEAGL